MAAVELSEDTRAVLLLCGRFPGAEPLAPRHYHDLCAWLERQELRPAALLQMTAKELGEDPFLPVEAGELRRRLEAIEAMTAAVEGWTEKELWVLSAWDDAYPTRLKALGRQAPPLLYGAGEPALLETGGLAVVGSRDADQVSLEYAMAVGRACAEQGITVVSGGARGIDSASMDGAMEAGGKVGGVLAGGLERSVRRVGELLADGRLTLISSYGPEAGFDAGAAMGRNKYIYALAEAALVVCSATGSGGTWSGAVEALKGGGTRVFVRAEGQDEAGLKELLGKGARVFPEGPWEDLRAALVVVEKQGERLD